MKLIVDENIVQGKQAFESFGNVQFINGREITNKILMDADALIVRSITKVDKTLLHNTKIKFVGTATIGTDHIDLKYLNENGIAFTSAAGCNSYSVAEYVFSALSHFAEKNNFKISEKSIGVIGYGNIGTKVIKIAKALGMKYVINDPPLERKGKENIFSSLEKALQCDIVTFHVPLNKTGIDKTVHLLGKNNIALLKNNAILINASRGPVVDNSVLEKRLQQNNNLNVVLDVWETEPNINTELFKLIDIGTPHIAGYSFEGKVTGTLMVYEALSEFLNTPKKWKPEFEVVPNNKIIIEEKDDYNIILKKLFEKSYKIIEDDKKLREIINKKDAEKDIYFDMLRKNYPKRRELNNFEAKLKKENEKTENLLKVLRVKINK
jgi:erythronate-4-phosphate dehydrogenase